MAGEKYHITMEDGRKGPFSLEEMRMLWATSEEITADTPYTLEVERMSESGGVVVERYSGYLGDIRDKLRPILQKNEKMVGGVKVVDIEEDAEKGKTELKPKSETAVEKEKREIEEKRKKLENKENIELDGWDTSSYKEVKKAKTKAAEKRKILVKRVFLLSIVVVILGYIFLDVVMVPKLNGRFIPESHSISAIRNNPGLFLDDLIRLRDLLGIEATPETWDRSVIPNFEFRRGITGTSVVMTQGGEEFRGTLHYLDAATAFIRLEGFKGLLYISSINEWETFNYYGVMFSR